MTTKHCLLHSDKVEPCKLNISDSIELVNTEHWNNVLHKGPIYLSLPYLKALDQSLSQQIDFRYITFYNQAHEPIGVAVVQLHRLTSSEIDYSLFSTQISDLIPLKLLKNMDVRIMLCGNAFSTGEHGFYFCSSVDEDIAIEQLVYALNRIKSEEKKSNDEVSFVLLKDFWPESKHKLTTFEQNKYRTISIDVNMILYVRENWFTWDDYINDLTTKFRTKAKGVYKKSEQIFSKKLDIIEIQQSLNNIEALYLEVLEKAKFRFGTLKAETFLAFKKQFPNEFDLKAYCIDNQMVGFSTCFISDGILDANFVGINYEVNQEYALYQRMLCDFVKEGIERGVKEIRFGRTAEEIKSCLGAEPISMKLLIKHRNHFTNTLMKPLMESIQPAQFDQRKPFKAAIYEEWIQ